LIKEAVQARAREQLGSPKLKYYKEHSRSFFANCYISIGKEFGVTTYKDLNPLDFDVALEFVNIWEYIIPNEN
jgi:hypothetical protein